MLINDIKPLPTERILIVGATGTGKTTLEREVVKSYRREYEEDEGSTRAILIIDPKCTYDPEEPGWKVVRRPGSLGWIGSHRWIHYRPGERHQNVEAYDEVYRWAYRRRDILVCTDETYLTMRMNHSPDWQRACVTCGRELGIGMIFCTQRPSGIDLRIYTESEHKICFYLAHDDDRKRMSQEMGRVVMIDPVRAAEELDGNPHPHAFWRWSSRERTTRLAELRLGNGGQNGV
jgi:hypothetical protein